MIEFKCSQCGICCVMAGKLGLMPAGEDGACINLGKDNLCTRYDERPDICSVEKNFYNYAPKGMTKTKYYKLNSEACNTMQEEHNIGKEYRLDPEIYMKGNLGAKEKEKKEISNSIFK